LKSASSLFKEGVVYPGQGSLGVCVIVVMCIE